jgi:uncharacterized protein (TIGR01777 family)
MRVVIPGGSGQVGHVLARHFHGGGHDVTVLSRGPRVEPWRVVGWDEAAAELEGSDVCVNLAGRSVNCRYHEANRREILESRVKTTTMLGHVIGSLRRPPRVWINASTATIYRHALDREMDEATGELGGNEPGAPDTWNFSIEVAKAWEEAFFAAATPRTRKVAIRSAMTMSPDKGGVFDVLSGLVLRGFGGAQGPGTQYVSWIHETDFCRAIDLIVEREDLSGVINVSSPNPLPNREFMAALREAWGVRFGLPVLTWMVEIGAFFKRTESELILKSRRVVPGRLSAAGFEFRFPTWPEAARDLATRCRASNPIRVR